jgi:hypothetical protein
MREPASKTRSWELTVKRQTNTSACGSTKSRIEKLGVKPGHDVLVLGVENDTAFMNELRTRGAAVRMSGAAPADVIFAAFRHRDDLRRLPPLVSRLKPDGTLWTLRPKGSKDLTESEMMHAGQAAGLVDVKVVSFSEILTAEKFVIPLARRSAHRPPVSSPGHRASAARGRQ